MHSAYLGLGSNIGNKKDHLIKAVKLLNEHPAITLTQRSSLYETEPWGYTEQESFLNAVVVVETELSPEELLTHCQKIEHALLRTREITWGPRTIDIDILIYSGVRSHTPQLTLPHPHLTERAFVLAPLAEVAPNLSIHEKKVDQWLSEIGETGITAVTPWEDTLVNR